MLTNLRLAQIYAVLRLELKKTFFAKRGLWIYLLAFAPAALFAGHTIVQLRIHRPCDMGLDTNIFATVFQFFYLRLAIFFGCLGIFMNLFRGEVLDKSLHFYFLAPIRRDVLLAAKFVTGLLAAILIFCTSTVVQFFALYWHFPSNAVQDYLFRNNGLSHLGAYAGVTALACVGYGSVFLAAGILLRNPIIPAAVILVWEASNSFLPAVLQKLSVIYYLKSLCPIEVPPQVPPPFALLAVNPDPISPMIAIPGLLLLSAVVLVLASLRIRHMEISYGTEN
jgi:ABC-type transport system involved in multi-copper enzyme maturation permease subunit